MAKAARQAIGKSNITVLADRGYFKGEEILECDRAGMTPLVPKPLTSGGKADGRFDKRDFLYNAKHDEYRCPAGERAVWRFTALEHGMRISRYWSSACPRCPLKAQCTRSNYRRISRWEHEQVLEAMQKRLERTPKASRLRRQTVEHLLGTLKAWMGSTHFLTKTLPRVQAEMSLHVLAYNLKRAMKILWNAPPDSGHEGLNQSSLPENRGRLAISPAHRFPQSYAASTIDACSHSLGQLQTLSGSEWLPHSCHLPYCVHWRVV
jgi:hypothetical protein